MSTSENIDGEQPSRRQKRAPKACEFCRHRKMKCNNEIPQCRNCKEHGKQCLYAELARKPRPSYARIDQLARENQQLRDELLILRDQVQPAKESGEILDPRLAYHPVDHRARSCRGPFLNLRGHSSPVPTLYPGPRSFSPDKGPSYHGQSSLLFEEKSIKAVAIETTVSDISTERQLVAESANQRQLEIVHFIAGELDFDGVDPDLGMHLLSIYWNRQHTFAPVVYRTAFMRDMACDGPYFSKLLLNAIYFYASKYTARTAVRQDLSNLLTAGWTYRQRAVTLLADGFDKSSIPTIQALLIMSSALFSWCDEKSTSWLYGGNAFNMIVDLGIHVNAATLKSRYSGEELEIRLRVFWSAYVIDKHQSLYQGRPSRIQSGTNGQMLFRDKHEELELFTPLSYTERLGYPVSPNHSISTFAEVCKLSLILDNILIDIYCEASILKTPTKLHEERNVLNLKLDKWQQNVTRRLNINSAAFVQLPNSLCLLAMFNLLIILLNRPFLSEGHPQSTSIDAAQDALIKCSAAASEMDRILQIYEKRYCHETTPYIISYGTYVSATIHVRLAAQRSPGSDAHKALQRCLDALSIHQKFSWSPRRAKRVIDTLIARIGVVFEDAKTSSSEIADVTTSDIDLDAFMLSFTQQPIGMSEVPNAQVAGESNGAGSCSHPQESQTSCIFNPMDEWAVPFMGEDNTFLWDPIFGFDGSTFDDLDLGFSANPLADG